MAIDNVMYLIDSTLRNSGTTQNASYNFIPAGSIGPGTYELLSLSMTNQFYNVETTNQDIFWDEGAADLTAVIPIGNYNITTLAAAMKIVMDIASASTFTITHNVDTGKFTFAIAAGTFRFKYLTNTTDVARRLQGFSATDGVLAANQISDLIVDLSLHTNIVIDVTQDANRNVTLLNGTEATFIVPITGSFGGIMDTLKRESFSQNMLLNANMNSLDIVLLDELGNALTNVSEYKLLIRRLF